MNIQDVKNDLIEEWKNSSGITTIDFIKMAVERGAKAHEEETRLNRYEFPMGAEPYERGYNVAVDCIEKKSKMFFEEV
jgi:hypothetical protein